MKNIKKNTINTDKIIDILKPMIDIFFITMGLFLLAFIIVYTNMPIKRPNSKGLNMTSIGHLSNINRDK